MQHQQIQTYVLVAYLALAYSALALNLLLAYFAYECFLQMLLQHVQLWQVLP